MSETPLNIEEIWKILPHRFPFLLVDRVIEIVGFESIKGFKNITINEPIFQGHFPNRPVFPGVLILEAMAQLGAILIMRRFPPAERMAYFTGIDNARFKRPVVPGDRLDMEVKITRDRTTFVIMDAKAFVNDQLAAQAIMSSALVK